MSLDLDLTFPIRDVPSANLMRLKATCLWNAGIIDDGERELVQQRAERFLRERKQMPRCGHQPCRATTGPMQRSKISSLDDLVGAAKQCDGNGKG